MEIGIYFKKEKNYEKNSPFVAFGAVIGSW